MKKTDLIKKYARCCLAAPLLLCGTGLQAADADLAKVAACVACHGADGVGKAEQYPTLQGQREAYLVKQLKDFKSGVRKDSSMNVIAESLSEADMKMLARFFAQVK